MAVTKDPFDLQRFVDAQESMYETVIDELTNGRKRSHWMWFVFPQLRELGHSPTALHYGISSRDEARAYLAHEVLGPRLRECSRLVAQIDGRSIEEIFGWPDNLKLRSSMTLFTQVTEDNGDFLVVLDKFYDSEQDPVTLGLLAQ